MRTPLIAGNWKMHMTLAPARELVKRIGEGLSAHKGVEVLICTPNTLLFPIAKAVAGTNLLFGAQDAHEAHEGAFTGEVSVAMLKDTGCRHVIIGHSERRHIYGEHGPLLAKKVRAVLDGGLTVVYCVGETLDDREAGRTEAVVERQLAEVLDAGLDASRLVLAYEPVWAIGTGKTATPEQAQDVHAFLRGKVAAIFDRGVADAMRILYGGSVKPGNAAGLMVKQDIDGALVGGACLVAADFLAIIAASAASIG